MSSDQTSYARGYKHFEIESLPQKIQSSYHCGSRRVFVLHAHVLHQCQHRGERYLLGSTHGGHHQKVPCMQEVRLTLVRLSLGLFQ